MRRDFEEFKSELLKRCDEYERKRKQRYRAIIATSTTLLLCVVAVTTVLMWNVTVNLINTASSMDSLTEKDPALPIPEAYNSGENSVLYGENPQIEAGASGGIALAESSVAYIEIIAHPENSESERRYTDPDKINAILDYFENLDLEQTEVDINISGGVSYKVTVVYEDGSTKTYEQLNNYVKEDYKGFIEVDYAKASQLEYLITTLPSD